LVLLFGHGVGKAFGLLSRTRPIYWTSSRKTQLEFESKESPVPQDIDINQLNTLIKTANAGWTAGNPGVQGTGGGGLRVFKFAAKSKGSASLQCGLSRSWEPSRPSKSFHVTVQVH
jgi:hypothetical protein